MRGRKERCLYLETMKSCFVGLQRQSGQQGLKEEARKRRVEERRGVDSGGGGVDREREGLIAEGG